ncbi:hypothetical protein CYLTODRAFT_455786 [Cylindrobasidium torrendii FP15055 ss-10]|uniref:F-box domain-containing protein n=1 Tax=Cylindrobasidium torrendii FP15055 ss-10 TaxID=1314674 RepID=A0A0D7B702_9AGAR|nr:hypothetical protein CYLTODRAFT_455786 [Cylindrobasidium torrendii FP15055 ss-10]
MALSTDLPPEICFLIFDFATAGDRQTALALLYVSRYVKEHCEPALYHTVVLRSFEAANVFTRCLSFRVDKSFCPRYIKSLIAYDLTHLTNAQLAHLLPAIRGVTNFFCWNTEIANDELGAIMPHLRSLYASRHPMVFPQTVTHMTVRYSLLETVEIYNATLRMPCLTHLAIEWFTGDYDERFIDHPNQNLKVLVVLVFSRALRAATERAKNTEADPRVVYVVHKSVFRLAERPWVKYDGTSATSVGLLQVSDANDLLYDYAREYPDPSKDSMWDIAEKIVEQRREIVDSTE